MKKRIVATLLVSAMAMSLVACGGSKKEEAADAKKETTEEAKDDAEEVADIADMTDDEIKAAMEKEPDWGETFVAYYDGGDCTSGPGVAKSLGYFDNWGLNVEINGGSEITEALGAKKAHFGVHHLTHMLVPITNDVDIVFTGTAQTGCKSLYVNADTDYKDMNDMVGKTVGVDGPIGSSAHNMAIRFCVADGANYEDITFVQVAADAAIQSLQSGEVDAVMLSDRYAKKFVDDGSVRYFRSLTWDDDFKDETCCVLAMNGEFVKDNPVIAQVITKCVNEAYMWINDNKDEAAKLMLDEGFVSGSEELTKYMLDQQNWAQTNEASEKTLRHVAQDYIDAGIIDSKWSIDEIVEKAWHPLGDKQ